MDFSAIANINLDLVIFIGFIVINLAFGLFYSTGVKTIKSYAVGDGNFSTFTIVSTIVATWVSGEFFVTIASETYNSGLAFIFVVLADIISYALIGIYCAPRMAEFIGKLSIAEAMGDLYGNNVRILTAITGFITIGGIIAIQLQIAGLLFNYALGIPEIYGTIILGIIITLYSSLGGIKSVSFTDIIQFCSFVIIIPVISIFLFNNVETKNITDTLSQNPLFDYNSVFSSSNPQLYYFISLILWLLIPPFNPAIFQRFSMSKNVEQAKKSFIISAAIGFLIASTVCWIGILILSIHPNIAGNDILKLIIHNYSWITGFKGLILAAIMAMAMSTVDSYINSSSILLIHDLRESLNIKVKDELYSSRICAVIIGVISILFAMRGGNFFELILWTSTCYIPIVTVPFMMSIFGFRSSSKSVIAGMGAGFVVVIFWEIFLKADMGNVGGLIPGMLANLITLVSFHYIFRQEGGWVGIKNPEPLIADQEERKEKLKALFQAIKSFNLVNVCRNNTPKSEGTLILFGLFVMVSTFINAVTMPKSIAMEFRTLVSILYPFTLFLSAPLIGYPLWKDRWENKQLVDNLAVFAWNGAMLVVLVCFSTMLILLSNFSQIQMIAFMINIIVISSLYKWRWALFNIIAGVVLTVYCYKSYASSHQIEIETTGLEYTVSYLLLLVSGVVIMLLRPKQEYMQATEAEVSHLNEEVSHLNEEVTHYSTRVSDQEKEIERLGATAQKILNNVNHELRLPIGNVVNFSDMLHRTLGKSNDRVLKELSEEVFKSSTRVSTMILNMLDLATLDVKKVDLEKKTINLSELIEYRVSRCQKIYLQDKDIDFKLIIEPEIMIAVDPNYIRQMVDNIVINAISYSNAGMITITLKKEPRRVILTISDQGIGITEKDKYDIFDPFKMGSKTESKAEGRGVGLALCKSVTEAHGGRITADSNGNKGALFTVILPI